MKLPGSKFLLCNLPWPDVLLLLCTNVLSNNSTIHCTLGQNCLLEEYLQPTIEHSESLNIFVCLYYRKGPLCNALYMWYDPSLNLRAIELSTNSISEKAGTVFCVLTWDRSDWSRSYLLFYNNQPPPWSLPHCTPDLARCPHPLPSAQSPAIIRLFRASNWILDPLRKSL